MTAVDALRFEEYVLDIARRELRHSGALVALEPQVFDLLVYVIRNRDRVVSKDDLVEAVWSGRAISDSTLTTRINAMRKALGDSGEEQRLIRTVARKGIRFVGSVTEDAVSATSAPPPEAPLPLPDKPSIAVMPFQNMSGDPGQEYFCDGMVEEIINGLSSMRSFFVIARSSSFIYRASTIDVREIGRGLGVRYVLQGSVRKVDDNVRIACQLVDTSVGTQIWASRFDGTMSDVFALQDEATAGVVGAVEPRLRQAEVERSRRKPTHSLDAYDHLLRAYAHCHPFTRRGVSLALDHLNKALVLDPRYFAAAGYAAWCYVRRGLRDWMDDIHKEVAEGCRLARIVAEGECDDPLALAYGAHALAYLGLDSESGLSLIERALQINPNSFMVCNIDGWLRLYTEDYSRAVRSFRRANRLNPLDPLIGSSMSGLALAHWHLREFDESLRWAHQAVLSGPNVSFAHTALISSLVSTGRIDEAKAAVRRLLEVDPSQSIRRWETRSAYRSRAALDARIAGFRVAGLPE